MNRLFRGWAAGCFPLYGDVCKYHPSCSAYGLRALQERGALVGSALAVWRILRCNPWSKGGYDPVPGTPEHAAWQAEQAAAATGSATRPSPVLSGHSAPGAPHNTRGEI